jgi:hypothetical protein
MPPLNERQLPAFRESLGKWASDVRHKRKPSGLACELSNAHELATSEPLDDRSLYVLVFLQRVSRSRCPLH